MSSRCMIKDIYDLGGKGYLLSMRTSSLVKFNFISVIIDILNSGTNLVSCRAATAEKIALLRVRDKSSCNVELNMSYWVK